MAYMRGDYYLWPDADQGLHIWVADGDDGWDQAIWAVDTDGTRRADRVKAGGVCIPEPVMDEFVVMRLAQLIEEGGVEAVLERALSKWRGNFGCASLSKQAQAIREALTHIKGEPGDRTA